MSARAEQQSRHKKANLIGTELEHQALEAELLEYCRERLAGYKRPRSVLLILDSEMPRTATGKILHRKLREQLARSDSSQAG